MFRFINQVSIPPQNFDEDRSLRSDTESELALDMAYRPDMGLCTMDCPAVGMSNVLFP